VLYGTVYRDSPVNGLVTLNQRFIDVLRSRVDLRLLVGNWATRLGDDRTRVTLGTHDGFPAVQVERDIRSIDRCAAPGDGPEIDRFVEALADGLVKAGIDLVHVVEWEPLTGVSLFAAADRARIPWIVMPVDYRLACPQTWLFEQRLRDCSGPDATFDKCARCMAVGAPPLDLRGRGLVSFGMKALYYSGARRAFPTLFAPRLPRYFGARAWKARFDAIRRSLDTCRAIVTISDTHARVLHEVLGLPRERFRVIHLPASPPSAGYRPDPNRFHAPLRFVWVHRLAHEWGPNLLLDAWRRAAVPPERARLWMYATKGAERWARGEGYGPLMDGGAVVVTDERVQGQEERVYGSAAAYVATPLWKVNGYSPDPLAYGFPMIFPRGTALEEMHTDGVNGFAYAQGDVESLAAVIRRLVFDPRLLEEAARRSVFTPAHGAEACGDKLLALYREIVTPA
jgi:hypothetical protein